MNTAVVKLEQRSLVNKFAARYSIDPEKLLPILKHTCFKVRSGEVSNEQMAALLVVADQYGLNPFCREIFAFPDSQNGIVPVVGVDGWSRIINDHEQADGLEFRYAEEIVELPDAQRCPAWCEVVVYRKDRAHPVIVREYLEECYRPAFKRGDGSIAKGPWQTHTKRFLRHKTLIQGARIAFGFGGIYDEDEAQRVIEGQAIDVTPAEPPKKGTAALKEAAARRTGEDVVSQGAEAGNAATAAVDSQDAELREIEQQAAIVADWVGQVADFATAEALEKWCAAVPEDIRTAKEFMQAVAERTKTLTKKEKK